MKAGLDLERLRTVHLVPLTAFDQEGQLNLTVQAEHIRRMYQAGIRVFMPAAGTSEFHSLSASEIVDIVRVTREASGPDALIFAPVGLQIGHAIDVGIRSREAGASGVMFMPFAHPYLCAAGIRDYYLEALEQIKLPALIYKKSPFPSDALLLELATHPWVVGVKYAENNLHDFRKVVMADKAANAGAGGTTRIEWLCGSAERFAPYYMLAGGTGFTTGAGNLCPHLALAMHAAFAAGEFSQGMELQQHLLPIEDYRAKDGDSYNISMLKHAISLLGSDFGAPRPPQRQLSSKEKTEIEQLIQPVIRAEHDIRHEMIAAGFGT
ncbi:MAG TPA: dihydrodipicolinate synthase family protein [Schlesneria sp.]